MEIALINPPFRSVKAVLGPSYPLGIGYIQAACKQQNIDVDLYDFSCSSLSNKELIAKYHLQKYSVIGITSYTQTFRDTAALAYELKQLGGKIIIGGAHATLLKEKILEDFDFIDFVLAGFGEQSFPALIKSIRQNSTDFDINGLFYRKNKSILGSFDLIKNNKQEINAIIFPDREKICYDFNQNEVIETLNTILTISSSRGCPYTCSYCVLCKTNFWLRRSAENIISEVEFYLSKNNSYKMISFVDDNFFVDCKRAESVINLIKDKYPDISFAFQTRADQIVKNKKFIERISASTKISISIGIESLSTEVLKRFEKGTSPQINQEAMDILRTCGVNTSVFLIMFDPFVTLKDIRKNLDFLKMNNLLSISHVTNLYTSLIPFYGTTYYEKYSEYFEYDIHGSAIPKFENKEVALFYETMQKFRNEYEDIIYETTTKIHAELTNSFDTSKYKDFIFLSKAQFLVFEAMLKCCEKYSYCDYQLLTELNLVTSLKQILKKHRKG